MAGDSYFGGKGGVFRKLINQIPPHRVFVSPFLGRCALMRRKLPAELSVGVEQDADVLAWWSGVDVPRLRLVRGCGIEFLERVFRGDVFRFDGIELPASSVFVYLDPPYLHRCRRSEHRYRWELSPEDHGRLLSIASGLRCMVMVSHYPATEYSSALDGWRSETFEASTRSGQAVEQVWTNYPEPVALHDYRWLGDGKRDRERFRRRVRNWSAGLRRMSRLERLAMFGELLAVMAEDVAVEDAALASASLGAVPFCLSGFPPLDDVTASGLDELMAKHRGE